MSRTGKKPITVPAGVTASVEGGQISVKGPKGTLTMTIAEPIEVTQEDGALVVTGYGLDGQAALAAGERIFHLLDLEPDVKDRGRVVTVAAMTSELPAFCNASHRARSSSSKRTHDPMTTLGPS